MPREDLPAAWRAESVRQHILYGEGRDRRDFNRLPANKQAKAHKMGGHLYGVGNPGKTEFPKGWTPAKIMDAVADTRMKPMWIREHDTTIEHVREIDGVMVSVFFYHGPNGEVALQAYPRGGVGVRAQREGRLIAGRGWSHRAPEHYQRL